MSQPTHRRYPNPSPSVVSSPGFRPLNKTRGSKGSLRRRLHYYYLRFLRLNGRPQFIARGLACGVFAGLFPLFGLQTIIGVLLAIPIQGSKIVAAAGTWVSNPLTYVPIYAFNFKVGQWLLGTEELSDVSLQSWVDIQQLGAEIISTLFVGCCVVGFVGAFISYFLGLWLICRGRASRRALREARYWSSTGRNYYQQHGEI